jgi:potassium channel subfamily K
MGIGRPEYFPKLVLALSSSLPNSGGTILSDKYRRLVAVNAVSLVFALIANLTLLLNMARRLTFRVAQPTTIWGFWIASVILIALIAVVSDRKKFHQPGVEDQALTQAYYYATFAAGLYQIISYLVSSIG